MASITLRSTSSSASATQTWLTAFQSQLGGLQRPVETAKEPLKAALSARDSLFVTGEDEREGGHMQGIYDASIIIIISECTKKMLSLQFLEGAGPFVPDSVAMVTVDEKAQKLS